MKVVHIERLKLMALAEHLEVSEYQASLARDSGKYSIYCPEEEQSLSQFMRRFGVDKRRKYQINYKHNNFVIVEEIGSE
jgi:hypothetical protein